MTRDLVARLGMTLALPATLVVADALLGNDPWAASLAPLLAGTASLGAVLALRRPRSEAPPRAQPADEVRDAA
jgi:hypothetical protein